MLPLVDFVKVPNKPYGRGYMCKSCTAKKTKEYRLKNLDKVRKKERIKSRQVDAFYRKTTILDRPDKKKCNHPPCNRIAYKGKDWCIYHWRTVKSGGCPGGWGGRPKKTKEEKREIRRNYDRLYRKNAQNRLAGTLRCRVIKILKDNMPQNKKTDTRAYYSKNIGCKGPELIAHLESKFYNHPITNEPMTWDNYGFGYGKWTIDHIRPLIDFIRNGEDVRKGNHFTNLQPMWFEENMKKGAKF